ncbi:helix-turn-helix transcriptional regulator [Nesterenkonia ebinurensis]|uniref:helix-turn-helix transcriptional regulator n=1 Tax=Nesterenkonia ebinurensis TaxID=2608252 RepID=UPI00123D5231|nr:AraC family transcriptional regulator [Nesterenkonia ebinurensis]
MAIDVRVPHRGSSLPITACSQSIHRPVPPVAFDCVRLVIVRHGSAIILSDFGEQPVRVGDVILLGANTLCGSQPEGSVTLTTIYLDRDYVIDQVFWQHRQLLTDRWEAADFAEELCAEPSQILHLGEHRSGMLMPWLDELVALSLRGPVPERFHRMQSLLFAVLDVVTPRVKAATRPVYAQQKRLRRHRLAPVRPEALQIQAVLREDPIRSWPLMELAAKVHLSPKQLSRVFSDAFGVTPRTYQIRLRTAEMARLLRDTDAPISEAGRLAGWSSRSRAHDAFKEYTGLSPSQYRNAYGRPT